ncbi:uncharacterized protein LOC143025572 [Oratosquilla oratoria]|uniref:uncharacterized protein LOC143025572 n=1 Tax=Oratosquilla oratoria TaxID=337810 RepID=UPI003F75FCD5
MAALHGFSSTHDSALDELPAWKRELILRKRANARIHSGVTTVSTDASALAASKGRGSLSGSGPNSSSVRSVGGPPLRSPRGPANLHHNHPKPPNPNLYDSTALASDCGGSGSVGGGSIVNHGDIEFEYNSANTHSSSGNMHHKGLYDEGLWVTSPTLTSYSDSLAQEEDDLKYGPGIVSKLKNRYMSLAMRETRSRPALRKFSSLEDLLDSDQSEVGEYGAWKGGRTTSPSKPYQHSISPESPTRRKELVLKRARSMEALSVRKYDDNVRRKAISTSHTTGSISSIASRGSPGLQSSLALALGKEDVIIIETSRPAPAIHTQKTSETQLLEDSIKGEPPPLTRKLSTSSLVDEDELPQPDTVRHVKQIFEPPGMGSQRTGGGRSGGTAAKVAAYKAAQGTRSNGVASKPALKAKPSIIPSRKVSPPAAQVKSHKLPSTIEDAKSSLKQVSQVNRAGPKSVLSLKATSPALNGDVTSAEGKSSAQKQHLGRTVGESGGLTPVTSSVTAPVVVANGSSRPTYDVSAVSDSESEEGSEVKRVSRQAIDNIRKESQSQEYNFASPRSAGQAHLPTASKVSSHSTKASSPTPTTLPPSPVPGQRVSIPPSFQAGAGPGRSPSNRPEVQKFPEVVATKTTAAAAVDKSVESKTVEAENRKNVEKSRSVEKDVRPAPFAAVRGDHHHGKGGGDAREPSKVVDMPKSSPTTTASTTAPSTTSTVNAISPRSEVIEAINTKPVESSSPAITPKTSSFREHWHQQENTSVVFNFTSSKKEAPDYIENDGIDLSRRRPERLDSGYVIMPGWEGCNESSDADDLDDPGLDYLDAPRPGVLPPPSGIVFEGEAVIINGRSNLQRQPKTKKLKISFDDAATRLFEYPSENTLVEEFDAANPPATESNPGSNQALPSSQAVLMPAASPQPAAAGKTSVTIRLSTATTSGRNLEVPPYSCSPIPSNLIPSSPVPPSCTPGHLLCTQLPQSHALPHISPSPASKKTFPDSYIVTSQNTNVVSSKSREQEYQCRRNNKNSNEGTNSNSQKNNFDLTEEEFVERMMMNLERGPKVGYEKSGSIKFRKNRAHRGPATGMASDKPTEEPEVVTAATRRMKMQMQRSALPPRYSSIEKYRRTLGSSKIKEEGPEETIIEEQSDGDESEDLSPTKKSISISSLTSQYQAIPDLVSMTQEALPTPQQSVEDLKTVKSVFRISKTQKSPASDDTGLSTNNPAQTDVKIRPRENQSHTRTSKTITQQGNTVNQFPAKEKQATPLTAQNTSSHDGGLPAVGTVGSSTSQRKAMSVIRRTDAPNSNSKTVMTSTGGKTMCVETVKLSGLQEAYSKSSAMMLPPKAQPSSNTVFDELLKKFGNDSQAAGGDRVNLRSVTTKEPMTVKALFPDYKYKQTTTRAKDNVQSSNPYAKNQTVAAPTTMTTNNESQNKDVKFAISDWNKQGMLKENSKVTLASGHNIVREQQRVIGKEKVAQRHPKHRQGNAQNINTSQNPTNNVGRVPVSGPTRSLAVNADGKLGHSKGRAPSPVPFAEGSMEAVSGKPEVAGPCKEITSQASGSQASRPPRPQPPKLNKGSYAKVVSQGPLKDPKSKKGVEPNVDFASRSRMKDVEASMPRNSAPIPPRPQPTVTSSQKFGESNSKNQTAPKPSSSRDVRKNPLQSWQPIDESRVSKGMQQENLREVNVSTLKSSPEKHGAVRGSSIRPNTRHSSINFRNPTPKPGPDEERPMRGLDALLLPAPESSTATNTFSRENRNRMSVTKVVYHLDL